MSNQGPTASLYLCIPKNMCVGEGLNAGELPLRKESATIWKDMRGVTGHDSAREGLIEIKSGMTRSCKVPDIMETIRGTDILK